jgi:trk system potassium uptake protein TrkH
MTVSLLFSGAALFYVFESENSGTIAGLDGLDIMLICLFQSVTLRTAGFATVNFGRCTRPMLMIMCFYMLTGGSPGGTAGGMKTTTVAVLSATASNTLKGNQNDAMISNRRISPEMLKQAFVVLYLYLATLFISLILLTVFEPGQDLLLLVFEAFSAIGTVGISAGITSSLSTGGRFVIMMLMFIGRLGPLSIYTAFQKEKKIITHVTYPDADIMIG